MTGRSGTQDRSGLRRVRGGTLCSSVIASPSCASLFGLREERSQLGDAALHTLGAPDRVELGALLVSLVILHRDLAVEHHREGRSLLGARSDLREELVYLVDDHAQVETP